MGFATRGPAPTRTRSLSELNAPRGPAPATFADYRATLAAFDRLPVHRDIGSVDAAVRAHLRATIPRDHPGPIVVVVGDFHGTGSSLAMAVGALMESRHAREKVFMTEAPPAIGRQRDYEATVSALTLYSTLEPGRLQRPLTTEHFAQRVFGGQRDRYFTNHVAETCAKFADFQVVGFDPSRDTNLGNPARERDMMSTISANLVPGRVLVVHAGAYHASELHRECSAIPGVLAVGVSRVTDPAPQNAENVRRLDYMLSTPSFLPVLAHRSLDRAEVDLAPLISQALGTGGTVNRLIDHYEAIAPEHPNAQRRLTIQSAPQ